MREDVLMVRGLIDYALECTDDGESLGILKAAHKKLSV